MMKIDISNKIGQKIPMKNIYGKAFDSIHEAIQKISSDYENLPNTEKALAFKDVSKIQEMLSEIRNLSNNLSIKNNHLKV